MTVDRPPISNADSRARPDYSRAPSRTLVRLILCVKDLAVQQTCHQAGLTDPVFGEPRVRDLDTVARERPENATRENNPRRLCH